MHAHHLLVEWPHRGHADFRAAWQQQHGSPGIVADGRSVIGSRERMSLQRFLGIRSTLAAGHLLTRIILPRNGRRTAHARLSLRKAGDYPVAIVSLAVSSMLTGLISAFAPRATCEPARTSGTGSPAIDAVSAGAGAEGPA